MRELTLLRLKLILLRGSEAMRSQVNSKLQNLDPNVKHNLANSTLIPSLHLHCNIFNHLWISNKTHLPNVWYCSALDEMKIIFHYSHVATSVNVYMHVSTAFTILRPHRGNVLIVNTESHLNSITKSSRQEWGRAKEATREEFQAQLSILTLIKCFMTFPSPHAHSKINWGIFIEMCPLLELKNISKQIKTSPMTHFDPHSNLPHSHISLKASIRVRPPKQWKLCDKYVTRTDYCLQHYSTVACMASS